MKRLIDILPTDYPYTLSGNPEIEIGELHIDSRQIKPSDVFIAINGTLVDGHRFIGAAIEKGATVVVCENLPTPQPQEVTFIQTQSTINMVGLLASAYYDHPSKKLKLVGVTGTNGKTTVATLLHKLYLKLGHKSGLLSTVENRINDEVYASTHTTPGAINLNKLLALMVDEGCSYCFMEVSSHAIHQKRIGGLRFEMAAFTNITPRPFRLPQHLCRVP